MINGMMWLAVLMFILSMGTIAQHGPLSGEQVFNKTAIALSNSFNNVSTNLQVKSSFEITNSSLSDAVVDIVYKLLDTFMYVVYKVTLIGMRFAVDNPQVNYFLILKLIVAVLILMILVPLIDIIIILYILISDVIKGRRERKRIKKLKEEKDANDKIR